MIRRSFLVLIAAGAASFATAADSPDVSGTWQFKIHDQGRIFTPTFTLTQSGTSLTGTYKNSQGDNPASGTVKGIEVTLNAQITGRDGEKRTVTYIATIDGDTMGGTMQTTRDAVVTFVARRNP